MKMRSKQPRRLVAVVATAAMLTAGLLLAAQESGRADRISSPTDRERQPLWAPGSDVPMVTYLSSTTDLIAPPR